MSELKYLPGLIPVVLFEYLFILALYRYHCCCKCRCCKGNSINDEGKTHPTTRSDIELSNFDDECNILLPAKETFRFEDIYESFLPELKYVLFVTRFLSFCYIGGVSIIAHYAVRNSHVWFYFTFWNAELISIFFLLAMSTSIIGFIYESRKIDNIDNLNGNGNAIGVRDHRIIWTSRIITLGRVVNILFEVCGGSACLVTVVAFTTLNPDFEFWNVTLHFITLLTLLIELFLNNMRVRADHYPFNISWLILYAIFIWPVVAMHRIEKWPYFFLKTDTYLCFFFFNGLIIINILFYYTFYSLSWMKFYLRNIVELRKLTRVDTRELKTDVELALNINVEKSSP